MGNGQWLTSSGNDHEGHEEHEGLALPSVIGPPKFLPWWFETLMQRSISSVLICGHTTPQGSKPLSPHYRIVHPPSMVMVWPVMLRAAEETRNSMVAATSSTVMNAFLGIGSSMILLITSSSGMPCA